MQEPTFPLSAHLQQRLKAARRALLQDLAVQVNASQQLQPPSLDQRLSTGGEDAEQPPATPRRARQEVRLSSSLLDVVGAIDSTRRQLRSVQALHERMGFLLRQQDPHTGPTEEPGELSHLYAPFDPLLRLAASFWRPLALGQSLAVWMCATRDSLHLSRIEAIVEAALEIRAQAALLSSWMRWARWVLARNRSTARRKRISSLQQLREAFVGWRCDAAHAKHFQSSVQPLLDSEAELRWTWSAGTLGSLEEVTTLQEVGPAERLPILDALLLAHEAEHADGRTAASVLHGHPMFRHEASASMDAPRMLHTWRQQQQQGVDVYHNPRRHEQQEWRQQQRQRQSKMLHPQPTGIRECCTAGALHSFVICTRLCAAFVRCVEASFPESEPHARPAR